MLTDAPPRKASRPGFLDSDLLDSDGMSTLDLPDGRALSEVAKRLESAMESDTIRDVRSACTEFLVTTSDFYRVPSCGAGY